MNAEEFFTKKNGGKSSEDLFNEGVMISPILAVRLMEEFHEAAMQELHNRTHEIIDDPYGMRRQSIDKII